MDFRSPTLALWQTKTTWLPFEAIFLQKVVSYPAGIQRNMYIADIAAVSCANSSWVHEVAQGLLRACSAYALGHVAALRRMLGCSGSGCLDVQWCATTWTCSNRQKPWAGERGAKGKVSCWQAGLKQRRDVQCIQSGWSTKASLDTRKNS